MKRFAETGVVFAQTWSSWGGNGAIKRRLETVANHTLNHKVDVVMSVRDTASMVVLKYIIKVRSTMLNMARLSIWKLIRGSDYARAVVQYMTENEGFHVVTVPAGTSIHDNPYKLVHLATLLKREREYPTTEEITEHLRRNHLSARAHSPTESHTSEDIPADKSGQSVYASSMSMFENIARLAGFDGEFPAVRATETRFVPVTLTRERVMRKHASTIKQLDTWWSITDKDTKDSFTQALSRLSNDEVKVLPPFTKGNLKIWITSKANHCSHLLNNIRLEEDLPTVETSKRQRVEVVNHNKQCADMAINDLVTISRRLPRNEKTAMKIMIWQVKSIFEQGLEWRHSNSNLRNQIMGNDIAMAAMREITAKAKASERRGRASEQRTRDACKRQLQIALAQSSQLRQAKDR
jgi:hypothetical protein